jgi:hypothetical protein
MLLRYSICVYVCVCVLWMGGWVYACVFLHTHVLLVCVSAHVCVLAMCLPYTNGQSEKQKKKVEKCLVEIFTTTYIYNVEPLVLYN